MHLCKVFHFIYANGVLMKGAPFMFILRVQQNKGRKRIQSELSISIWDCAFHYQLLTAPSAQRQVPPSRMNDSWHHQWAVDLKLVIYWTNESHWQGHTQRTHRGITLPGESSFCLQTNKIGNLFKPPKQPSHKRHIHTVHQHPLSKHTRTQPYSLCPWPQRWTPPYPRPCLLRWPPRSKSPWCRPQPPSSAGLPRRWHRGCGTPGDTVSWLMLVWHCLSWARRKFISLTTARVCPFSCMALTTGRVTKVGCLQRWHSLHFPMNSGNFYFLGFYMTGEQVGNKLNWVISFHWHIPF